MRTHTYTEADGTEVTETLDRKGRVVSRTTVSPDRSVTNVARGNVGSQAGNISGSTVVVGGRRWWQ